MTLPEGWAKAAVGDVAPARNSKVSPAELGNAPFIGLEHIEPHTGRLIDCGKATDVKSSVATFESGDILFGRLRPYLNKVFAPDFDGCASAEFVPFVPVQGIEGRYLQRVMMSPEFLEFTASLDRGDRPRVSAAEVSGYSFNLPPVAEQRRIVAKLDALTARLARARAELDRVPVLVAKLRRECLNTAFSEAKLEAWATDDLANVVADGLIGLVRSKAEQGMSGAPYLRMGHYDLDGRFNDNDVTAVECSTDELGRFELHAGDVLFNTRNSVELVGKVAIWPADRPGWVFNNNLLRLRFRKDIIPSFAFRYMMSPCFRTLMAQKTSATTSVAAIYQRSLYAAPFPVPNMDEQREIVSTVEAAFARIDRMEAEAARARTLLDRLEAAILAKAFRGELVPQHPNDEPASVLLDRIRAERAAAPKPKRGRRKKAKA